jgi:HD-GYP domain-containing protein (c-di-GMP phosphodiesterase class II)
MDRKVSTANLKVGMYVSKLDRPWVQTPFLIQGFFIKDEVEICSLVKYCSYVFIDIELGVMADMYLDSEQIPSARPGIRLRQRLATNKQVEGILETRKSAVVYIDKETTVKELPEAKAALEKASEYVAHLLEHDLKNGQLDIVAVKAAIEPILDSMIRNSDAFMWLSKMRFHDAQSYEHSVQNCALGIAFGRHIGLDKKELNTLAAGILLMDIGKVRLPKELLTKSTPLTSEETEIMRKHVAFSVEILRKTKGINEHVINIALTHHERYDGSGYPNALVGMQTPAFGRMAAIIDCYDEMITTTPYREAIPEHKALQNIYNLRDKYFQKELVEVFMQCMGVYPTGSLVELSSGAVAAVLSQNTEQRLKPKLVMLLDENKQPYQKHLVFDLTRQGKTPLNILKSLDNNAYGLDVKQIRV